MRKKTGDRKKYLFEDIINVLKKSSGKQMNYRQISAQLNIQEEHERKIIRDLLRQLAQQKQIIDTGHGKYQIKVDKKFISGKVEMTAKGSAYIVSEESENDIFVSENNLRGA